MSKAIFQVDEFTSYEREYPGGHGTALYKARLANDIVRFIQSGFKRGLFTKSVYNGLNSMFGHIAHYNIDGFYSVWFEDNESRMRWLDHVQYAHLYGDPQYTLVDVEHGIQNWVIESNLRDDYADAVGAAIEEAERAELARLKAKYEGD